MIVNNNSEIILIIDCINANPNGNPDAENFPRMDEDTEIALVSDLRIKRNIRDYLSSKGEEIFVSKEYDVEAGRKKTVKAEDRVKSLNRDVQRCIDVRLFGGVFPVSKDNFNLTGPVQFEWGTSMHKCIVSDHGITTTFKTKDSGKDSVGSMGRDKRVDYALISTRGRVNANSAKDTNLTEEDIDLFDESMVNLFSEVNTRSKIGQTVRLYMRVETINHKNLKRLEEYIEYKSELEYPKALKDGYLELSELLIYLDNKKDIIGKIYIYVDDKIDLRKDGEKINLISELTELGVEVRCLEG